MATIADESISRLAHTAESVRLAERTELGSVDAPGLNQLLEVRHRVGDTSRDLVQCQVYLSMVDSEEPGKRAVLQLTLTATAEQLPEVVPDFQAFVSSVRPEGGDD